MNQNPWTAFDPDGLRKQTKKEKKELEKKDKKAKSLNKQSDHYKNLANKAKSEKKQDEYNKKASELKEQANKVENSARGMREIIDRMEDGTKDISDIVSGEKMPWILEATGYYGLQEGKDGNTIENWHKQTTLPSQYAKDSTPWCSSFLCGVMNEAGLGGTNNAGSQSWNSWGQGQTTKNPAMGSVVVFQWKKGGSSGHVGVVVGYNKSGSVLVLGGNQGGKRANGGGVNLATFSDSKVRSYRMPNGVNPGQFRPAPRFNSQGSKGTLIRDTR